MRWNISRLPLSSVIATSMSTPISRALASAPSMMMRASSRVSFCTVFIARVLLAGSPGIAPAGDGGALLPATVSDTEEEAMPHRHRDAHCPGPRRSSHRRPAGPGPRARIRRPGADPPRRAGGHRHRQPALRHARRHRPLHGHGGPAALPRLRGRLAARRAAHELRPHDGLGGGRADRVGSTASRAATRPPGAGAWAGWTARRCSRSRASTSTSTATSPGTATATTASRWPRTPTRPRSGSSTCGSTRTGS